MNSSISLTRLAIGSPINDFFSKYGINIRRFLPFSSSDDGYKIDRNEKYEEYSKTNPDNSRKDSISYRFFDQNDSQIAFIFD